MPNFREELFTLPIGPNEIGASYYAQARLGVRNCAIYVWGEAAPGGMWFSYLSRCAKYSITILDDAIGRLTLAGTGKLTLITDTGPHFRSWEVSGI